jgi:hypothetical protein
VYVAAAEQSKAWGEARRAAVAWVKADGTNDAKLTLARLERATGNSEKAYALVQGVLAGDGASPEAERLLASWSKEQRLASR